MTTKEKLALMLEEGSGEYISGRAIAEELGITRAAIWKNIHLLENDGYIIEAVTNKGYRLAADNDAVSLSCARRALGEDADKFELEVMSSINSTNTYLKEKATDLPDGHVAIAGNQTSGRGRTGRSFFSPPHTGVYLSILLKRDIPAQNAGRLTTAAAIAACRAIENTTDAKPEIKWVNDVFIGEKKVCGILTEASVNFETGAPDWIITGIGFNVYKPEGGFPEEIADIAGAVTHERRKDLRCRIAAEFLKAFDRLCSDLNNNGIYEEYRSRCFILGRDIYVLKGGMSIPAKAVDIDKNFALTVRYDDGRCEVLNAGEVSTRPV